MIALSHPTRTIKAKANQILEISISIGTTCDIIVPNFEFFEMAADGHLQKIIDERNHVIAQKMGVDSMYDCSDRFFHVCITDTFFQSSIRAVTCFKSP